MTTRTVHLVKFDQRGYYAHKQPNYEWAYTADPALAHQYKTLKAAHERGEWGCSLADGAKCSKSYTIETFLITERWALTGSVTGSPSQKEPETARAGEDEAMFGVAAWVYCNQHLRPHLTGWCTVSTTNKIRLDARTQKEAFDECRLKGYTLYDPA